MKPAPQDPFPRNDDSALSERHRIVRDVTDIAFGQLYPHLLQIQSLDDRFTTGPFETTATLQDTSAQLVECMNLDDKARLQEKKSDDWKRRKARLRDILRHDTHAKMVVLECPDVFEADFLQANIRHIVHALLSSLVTYVNHESRVRTYLSSTVDMHTLLQGVVEDFALVNRDQTPPNICVNMPTESIMSEVYDDDLHILLWNMIRNAQHAEATRVGIKVKPTKDGVHFTVKDNGTGIVAFEKNPERIFQFSATGTSDTSQQHGIGLRNFPKRRLCDQEAEAHGGYKANSHRGAKIDFSTRDCAIPKLSTKIRQLVRSLSLDHSVSGQLRNDQLLVNVANIDSIARSIVSLMQKNGCAFLGSESTHDGWILEFDNAKQLGLNVIRIVQTGQNQCSISATI